MTQEPHYPVPLTSSQQDARALGHSATRLAPRPDPGLPPSETHQRHVLPRSIVASATKRPDGEQQRQAKSSRPCAAIFDAGSRRRWRPGAAPPAVPARNGVNVIQWTFEPLFPSLPDARRRWHIITHWTTCNHWRRCPGDLLPPRRARRWRSKPFDLERHGETVQWDGQRLGHYSAG